MIRSVRLRQWRRIWRRYHNKIGRGLAIRWVISTKNPLEAFERKVWLEWVPEYDALKSELGEYLANRWIVNNPRESGQERISVCRHHWVRTMAKLQEAVGEYMAKRWIVRYRSEAWSKYQDLQTAARYRL